VLAADGFGEYGEMTVHALGRVSSASHSDRSGSGSGKKGSSSTEVYKLGRDPTFVPLGAGYRTCERAQRNKYARLKSKAFATLHKHVLGDFEPFVKDDRKQIPNELMDRIRALNFLDHRLHQFARKLFDARYEENKAKIEREVLPSKLPA
jgi:hypothetical protein